MEVPPPPLTKLKKEKRTYTNYYKDYYATHRDTINARRSTGKPRGRPRKVSDDLAEPVKSV